MSRMARWNRVPGRCGDREKRSRGRAISEKEDPSPTLPSMGGRAGAVLAVSGET